MSIDIAEILKQYDGDLTDECQSCVAHELAYDVIDDNDAVACPKCGNSVGLRLIDALRKRDTTVISETNSPDGPQDVRKRYVVQCDQCREHVAFMPQRIIWNANHDIYYTGVSRYLYTEENDKLSKALKRRLTEPVAQFTRRIREGENLHPDQLVRWIRRGVETVVAEFLVEKGFREP